MKTYVLVVARSRDSERRIACRLNNIEEIKEISAVDGFADLVVEVETESFDDASLVIAKIRENSDVWRTFSLAVVSPFKKREKINEP